MDIKVKIKYFKKLYRKMKGEQLKELVDDISSWRGDEDFHSLSLDSLSIDHIKEFYSMLKLVISDDKNRAPVQRMASYLKTASNPEGAKPGNLSTLENALKQYIKKTSPERFWIYGLCGNYYLPYLVTSIRYIPYSDFCEAHTTVSLSCRSDYEGSSRHLSFHQNDLGDKKTIKEILADSGFSPENKAFYDEYEKHLSLYKKLSPQIGMQFTSPAGGFLASHYYSSESSSLRVENIPDKIVIDTKDDEDENNRSSGFGRRNRHSSDDDSPATYWHGKSQDRAGNDILMRVPFHAYIRTYDLTQYCVAFIHAADLLEYEYDKSLINKLIISQDMKDLLTLLGSQQGSTFEDIIQGKSSGIIVLASGEPGLGKTLSAEVYSEFLECPLYKVQCSQLGTDDENIETNLQKILERAARWKAILLIDEADVYIHDRAGNMKQNAIVGVFLRLLEYYKGVMFLTTNRATVVDDAIMSRVTIHLKYGYPDSSQAPEIWKVHLAQYEHDIKDSELVNLASKHSDISGRSIKNIIMLSNMLALKDGRVGPNAKDINTAARYAVVSTIETKHKGK